MQDADRISDFVVYVLWNGLQDSGIQFRAEGAEAPVSLHILSSGGKRSCHGPSILAEEVGRFKLFVP